MKPTELLLPSQRAMSNAYLVNRLREAVFDWRKEGYPGITPTTRRLLQFWFYQDHELERDPFEFWFCQREAIETLIYVYEVCKTRTFIDLAKAFGSGPIENYDPNTDLYPLYAFKMATGSGKTFVMALSIVWQYFNHWNENSQEYTSKFLIIAGEKNVIYDRLVRDFKNGDIFKKLPFIPPEWREDFDLQVILKEEPIRVVPESALFLTNIQQLQDEPAKKKEVESYIEEVMDLPEIYSLTDVYQENRIREVLETCPNIMILKDEAHHIYDTQSKWKNILLDLHEKLKTNHGEGINMELDFSATPKTKEGRLFPWIIVDFPLKEAIEMNIVKRPLEGTLREAKEIESEKLVERFKAWIDVGISRWREYRAKLKPLNKKPVLFFQCQNNSEADELYSYLETVPDIKGKALLIHTDKRGEVTKTDLELARLFVRNIDDPDPEKNPYEIVVSTMMLNEGWDVRNVNVIVGLRSYTSKRQVLPEQVIGRGLRKMFPEEEANVEKCINVLEIIGPSGLTEILSDLEKQEGLKLSKFDTDRPVNLPTIYVDPAKADRDIELPFIITTLLTSDLHLDTINFEDIPPLNLPLRNKILETEYVAYDLIEGYEVIRRKWLLPVPQESKSVISYFTDQILQRLRIKGHFADFHPIVKRYVVEKLFDQKVDLDDPRVLCNLTETQVFESLIDFLVETFRDLTFKHEEMQTVEVRKLSDTPAFVWPREIFQSDKTIFNYVACDNMLEVRFAKFLHQAKDVRRFSKLVPKVGFFVEYKDSENHLRHYYPDFVVVTDNGEHFIVETKGRVDMDVPLKDSRMKEWCKDASRLRSAKWSYIRVNQDDFDKYDFRSFADLVSTLGDIS